MIPIFRALRPESAATLLLRHFRHLRIDCAYDNVARGLERRVRFRADLILSDNWNVYFANAPTQVERWRENGGALICWTERHEIACDALLFAEAPKRLERVAPILQNVRACAVIYEPTSWRAHEEILRHRHKNRPHKLARALRKLALMETYVGGLPILTGRRLVRLRARAAAFQSLLAPASPEGAAPSHRTGAGVP